MSDGNSRKGFASMDPERRRELASKGGLAVPAASRSFSDPEVARAAALKSAESRRLKRALRGV